MRPLTTTLIDFDLSPRREEIIFVSLVEKRFTTSLAASPGRANSSRPSNIKSRGGPSSIAVRGQRSLSKRSARAVHKVAVHSLSEITLQINVLKRNKQRAQILPIRHSPDKYSKGCALSTAWAAAYQPDGIIFCRGAHRLI